MRYHLDFFICWLLLWLGYFGLVAPRIKKHWPQYYTIAGWTATVLLFVGLALFEYFTEIDVGKTVKKSVGDSFCYFYTVASCPVEFRDWAAKRATERAEAERKRAAEIAETERRRAAEEAAIQKAAAAERLVKEEALRARREASMRELESFETKRRESELAKRRADEDAWLSATRPETIGGLKRYLRQHLLGRYAENAKVSIAALEEEGRRARDRVLRGCLEGGHATRDSGGSEGLLAAVPKGFLCCVGKNQHR